MSKSSEAMENIKGDPEQTQFILYKAVLEGLLEGLIVALTAHRLGYEDKILYMKSSLPNLTLQ